MIPGRDIIDKMVETSVYRLTIRILFSDLGDEEGAHA
jgi:hypothetical protein